MPRNTTLFLFLSIFVTYAFLSFKLLGLGGVAGGDEAEYLAVAHSLIEDHDIYLEDEGRVFEPHYSPSWKSKKYLIKDQTSGKEFFPPYYTVNVIPAKGHLLPYHPIGLSLLVLPGLKFLGIWGARLIIALCATFLALNIYFLSGSLLLALLLIFSPPLLCLSLLVFNEIPAALLTTYAYRKIKEVALSKFDRGLVSSAIAFLPWLHPKYILISGLLFLFLYQQRKPKTQTINYLPRTGAEGDWFRGQLSTIKNTLSSMRHTLFALAISLLALVSFYTYFYGTWKAALATGHPGMINPLIGGAGLLFDRDYGLLLNAPLYLLAILGFIYSVKSFAKDWFRPALISLFFLGNGFFANWHGGAAPPGRLLVPALPFLGLYIPKFVKKCPHLGQILVSLTFVFGLTLVALNLFQLKNLGFATPNGINEAYDLFPYGRKFQMLFPNLVR